MSVYYYNGAQILAPLSITSNEPMYEVETISLKIQRTSHNIQRWEISFNVLAGSDTQTDLFVSSVESLDSVKTMIIPQLPSVAEASTSSTSLAIAASTAAGQNSVTVSNDGVIPKGSFVKFSNHDKVYMTTSTVNAGTQPVPIFPTLRVPVTTSDTLKTRSDALLTYYRSIDNASGITFNDGVLSSLGTIELIEVL